MNLTAFSVRLIARAAPRGLISALSRNQWRYPKLRRLCAWGASLLRSRDGVIQHGAGKGLRFNIGNSHSGFILGTHKPGVQNFLAASLNPGMVFYDAGANAGFYSIIAARLVGHDGHVVCFEPLPANARLIEHNAQLNGFSQINVRCEALGNSDRTESFLTSSEPTWGRLATSGKVPDQKTGEIVVSVRALDSVLTGDGLPAPDLIKIDVEGAEGELISGAKETLCRNRPLLIIELHGTNNAVAAALEDLNYHVVVMGSSIGIAEAHWNATVAAAPRENKMLVDFVANLSNPITV